MDSETQKKLAEAIIKYAPSKKEVATLVGQLVKQLKEVHSELDNNIKSIDSKALTGIESLKTAITGEIEGVKKLIDQSTNSSKAEAFDAVKALGETNNLTVKQVRDELKLATENLTKFISDTTKKSSDEMYKTINREAYLLDKKINEVPQFDPTQLEAKWSAVIEGIQQTPVPETTLDILAIRDGLESLIGDDRFDVDAINGLNELQTKWTNAVLDTVNILLSIIRQTHLRLDQSTPQSVINGSPVMEGIQFNTTPTTVNASEGLLRWNSTDGTLDLGMSAGTVTMQIGQELFTKVRNESGYQTITNGQAVYISGRTGVYPDVQLARSDVEATSRVLGIATQDIASPAFGYVTTLGYIRGIKTDYTGTGIWGDTWVTGDLLYVSKTNAGVLTNIEPDAPHHSDTIGTVGVVSSNQGSILVTLDRHKTLEELTDVDGTPLTTSGQFPVWNQTTGYFDFNYNVNSLPSSGITRTIVVTSGDTTLGEVASTDYICLVNGNHVITMPTAVSNTNQYSIKNLHSAAITVNTTSSQTIDGTTTIQISPEDSVDLASNNSNWFII